MANSGMANVTAARAAAARRKGEALFEKRADPQDLLKQEQQVEQSAVAAKTERLRALRLAKEAAEKAEAASRAAAKKAPRTQKQA